MLLPREPRRPTAVRNLEVSRAPPEPEYRNRHLGLYNLNGHDIGSLPLQQCPALRRLWALRGVLGWMARIATCEHEHNSLILAQSVVLHHVFCSSHVFLHVLQIEPYCHLQRCFRETQSEQCQTFQCHLSSLAWSRPISSCFFRCSVQFLLHYLQALPKAM